MPHVSLPPRADLDVLGEAICAVLENVGALFQSEELLHALEAAGARVDYAAERAWFPGAMAREFVAQVRQEVRPPEPAPLFPRLDFPGMSTQVAQYVYDFDRRDRHPGATADLIEMTKLGDALDRADTVGHSVLLQDVPPLLEPLEAGLVLAEYAHHPGPPFAWNVAQEPYLREMGEILGRRGWYTWGAVCIAHPLRFDRAVAARYVKLLRGGRWAGITAMPVVGLSTPVTVEGFIVVAAAELVASWIAGRALNPEVSLGGSMWAGTPDMRTGQVSFSAFDAMLYGIAVTQFLQQWCGVEIAVGGGEYSAAKEPGLYAGLEKAYKAMTIAAFTGRHPSIGEGMVDCGKVLSDVQLLIDRELTAGLQQYARPVRLSAEAIGLDSILEIGLGLHASHLQSDHTAHHFRECLWMPEFLRRTGWNGAAEEEETLRGLREKAKDLVASYRKPEGREDQLAAMRAVVERARRELLQ
jgi:trimethylamine:corrinoid methyltransferase-like protein